MPNYDFESDLPIAERTEHQIADIIRKHYNAVILGFCHDNRYDIKARINGKDFTFEVKEDFTCEHTGNVGLEYECRSRPSGIAVSKADFYIYKIHTSHGVKVFIFKTDVLKNMIVRKEYFRIVNGGDVGSGSKNFLFRYDEFVKHGKQIA